MLDSKTGSANITREPGLRREHSVIVYPADQIAPPAHRRGRGIARVYPNNAAKLEDGVWKFDVAAFSYKNPVSGRVPPLYCPDLKTCEQELEAEKHGLEVKTEK